MARGGRREAVAAAGRGAGDRAGPPCSRAASRTAEPSGVPVAIHATPILYAFARFRAVNTYYARRGRNDLVADSADLHQRHIPGAERGHANNRQRRTAAARPAGDQPDEEFPGRLEKGTTKPARCRGRWLTLTLPGHRNLGRAVTHPRVLGPLPGASLPPPRRRCGRDAPGQHEPGHQRAGPRSRGLCRGHHTTCQISPVRSRTNVQPHRLDHLRDRQRGGISGSRAFTRQPDIYPPGRGAPSSSRAAKNA